MTTTTMRTNSSNGGGPAAPAGTAATAALERDNGAVTTTTSSMDNDQGESGTAVTASGPSALAAIAGKKLSASDDDRSRRSTSSKQRRERRRQQRRKKRATAGIASLASNRPFQALVMFLLAVLAFQLVLVSYHDEIVNFTHKHRRNNRGGSPSVMEPAAANGAVVNANVDVDFNNNNNKKNQAQQAQQAPPLQQRRQQQQEQQQQQQEQQQAAAPQQQQHDANEAAAAAAAAAVVVDENSAPHLFPVVPPLPVFAPIDNGPALAAAVYDGSAPTVAGVMHILQSFLEDLHDKQIEMAAAVADRDDIIAGYIDVAKKRVLPFDERYRGRSVFPVREDGSVFVSIAAFRDYLLGDTLKDMFRQAKRPDKLYVGAVVQNCFGLHGYQCKTGLEVIGKNEKGRDMTKISDAPPDRNGVAEFCQDAEFAKYCAAGHVRAVYVRESESLGPSFARYLASKLHGGETYYMQIDAHLQFAEEWDAKYTAEIMAAKSYPKAVLSSYPPGIVSRHWKDTAGARLCSCEFSANDIEEHIIRINTGSSYGSVTVDRPKQIPFIAAGFFFARSEFLVDVPYDPILPWTFMGEEIALSMRAWTSGWDIYAPRKNWIAHQYRPGRLGLPKFWESVTRVYTGRGGGFFHRVQARVIQRVKHLVGYPDVTAAAVTAAGNGQVLTEAQHYGMGTVRTREEYLQWASIDVVNEKCHVLQWCNRAELD